MSTLNINLNNVQPLDTILTGLSGLAYSGNQGLFIKVNATADGFEFAAGSGGVPYTGATQDVNLGEYELKAGQIEYDQTPTGTAGVAVTRWNDSIGTLETTLKGGNVVLKHGRDLFERVVNKTGIQLTKAAYQAVRISTAQGQRLGVALAQANNDNNSADTIGLVVETIDNNQEGIIYVVGEIDGINTTGSLQSETWADGDVLYLSPTTAGRITNVKPTAPQHLVVIGYVVYSHATQGKIYVKVMNGYELGELHDVDTTGATNGQVLKYNGSIWTAQTDLNSGVWGSITGTLSSQTDLQTALDGKVDENAAITGATKTKITYDAKGLVTAGADATTADIADSSNKRYVTDAQLVVIGNTSGTNSGNQTLANTSDATSHTVTLSATGGSVQLVEGSGITLTTTGTAADGIITIASSGGGGSTFADNVFEIYDNTDNTKKLAFEASGITTGTTRTLTIPNASGTIALTSDLSSYVPYTGATTSVNLGANNLTVDTNVLFADATNNRVGIGTNAPSAKLHVVGTGTTSGTTAIKVVNSASNDVLRVTDDGNIQGIGFRVNPGNPLQGELLFGTSIDTYSTSGGQRSLSFLASPAVPGTERIQFGSYTNGQWYSQLDILNNQGGTTANVYLMQGAIGFLGIRTNNPKAPVHIGTNPTASANYGTLSLGTPAAFDGSTSGFFTGVAAGTVIAVNLASGGTSDLLNMQVAGVNRFKVSSAGVVSINAATTDASAQLQVDSTTKGFAMPRMTGAQVEAISTPLEGLIAYASSAGATSVKSKGVYHYTGSAWEKISGQTVATITFIIDGGGSAITTGIKGDIEIPFACTINQVTMLADTSGSIVVDIWKDTYANYPPTVGDTITASAKPTISAATKSQDATLTGWTNTISAGDTLRFNVDSASTVTRVTISLKITKS